MDTKIHYADGTVKTIVDTRTPEEKEAYRIQVKQQLEDWYNRPENAEAKRERDEREARILERNQMWAEQDRLEAERKKQYKIDAAKYRAERDARDAKNVLKHLCLLPIYIVGLPFILLYFFIKSCIKNGVGNTFESISDGIASAIKVLPYILFPPLILLELFGALYGE